MQLARSLEVKLKTKGFIVVEVEDLGKEVKVEALGPNDEEVFYRGPKMGAPGWVREQPDLTTADGPEPVLEVEPKYVTVDSEEEWDAEFGDMTDDDIQEALNVALVPVTSGNEKDHVPGLRQAAERFASEKADAVSALTVGPHVEKPTHVECTTITPMVIELGDDSQADDKAQEEKEEITMSKKDTLAELQELLAIAESEGINLSEIIPAKAEKEQKMEAKQEVKATGMNPFSKKLADAQKESVLSKIKSLSPFAGRASLAAATPAAAEEPMKWTEKANIIVEANKLAWVQYNSHFGLKRRLAMLTNVLAEYIQYVDVLAYEQYIVDNEKFVDEVTPGGLTSVELQNAAFRHAERSLWQGPGKIVSLAITEDDAPKLEDVWPEALSGTVIRPARSIKIRQDHAKLQVVVDASRHGNGWKTEATYPLS